MQMMLNNAWTDGAGDGGGAATVQGGTKGGGQDGQGGFLLDIWIFLKYLLIIFEVLVGQGGQSGL